MQEIIMQSMKEHEKGAKGKKAAGKSTAATSYEADMPFIEGEDLNESFIAKQLAIEEELKKRR